MTAENIITFGPFAGLKSGLPAAYVQPPYTRSQINLTADGGDLAFRKGYAAWSNAPSGFAASRLFSYISGSNDDQIAETILSIEKRSGTTKPYEIDLTTGVRSLITAADPLTDTPWHVVTYAERAIVFARGTGQVYAHEIGDLDSWYLLDAAAPATAYSPPQVDFAFTESIENDDPQAPFNWAGATADTVEDRGGDGGAVAFAAVGTGNRLECTATTQDFDYPTARMRFVLDEITAGEPDLEFSKRIDFALIIPSNTVSGSTFITNLSGIRVWLVNDEMLPITVECVVTDTVTNDPTTGTWPKTHNLKCAAPSGATFGTSFDGTAYIELEFTYDPVASGNEGNPWNFYIGPVTPTNVTPASPTISDPSRIQFAHVPYDSLRDVEATHVRNTDWFGIESPNRYALDGGTALIGNVPTLTAGVPTDADAVRYFVRFGDDTSWRILGTREIADTALAVNLTENAMRALPLRTAPAAESLGSPVYAFPHAGAMFYLYDRGTTNIRASWNGTPERLRKITDDLDNIARGVDWTLADGATDAPKWGASSGDAALILGSRGAYSMPGGIASEMGPPKKLANSRGVYGTAAARYRGPQGQAGVIFVGTDMGVWFAWAAEGVGGDAGGYVLELAPDQRDLLTTWLGIDSSTDPELLTVTPDDITDSVWFTLADRAVVLRRASLIDGERQWETYEYTGADWLRATFVPGIGVRTIDATGRADQLERDPTTGAPITGAEADNGDAPPNGSRQLARIQGPRIRIHRIAAHRQSNDLDLEFTVVSRKGESGEIVSNPYTLVANKTHVRLNKSQHGDEHDITLIVPPGHGPITAIQAEIWPMQQRIDS